MSITKPVDYVASEKEIQSFREVQGMLAWIDQRAAMEPDHPLLTTDRTLLDEIQHGLPMLRLIDIKLLRRFVASFGSHERCVLLGLLADLVFVRQIGGRVAPELRTLEEQLRETLDNPRLTEASRRSYRQVTGG